MKRKMDSKILSFDKFVREEYQKACIKCLIKVNLDATKVFCHGCKIEEVIKLLDDIKELNGAKNG